MFFLFFFYVNLAFLLAFLFLVPVQLSLSIDIEHLCDDDIPDPAVFAPTTLETMGGLCHLD